MTGKYEPTDDEADFPILHGYTKEEIQVISLLEIFQKISLVLQIVAPTCINVAEMLSMLSI